MPILLKSIRSSIISFLLIYRLFIVNRVMLQANFNNFSSPASLKRKTVIAMNYPINKYRLPYGEPTTLNCGGRIFGEWQISLSEICYIYILECPCVRYLFSLNIFINQSVWHINDFVI